MKVYVTLYEHKHGSDVLVYSTLEAAQESRRAVAAEWWEREMRNRKKPECPEAAADAYFDYMADHGEYFEIMEKDVIS